MPWLSGGRSARCVCCRYRSARSRRRSPRAAKAVPHPAWIDGIAWMPRGQARPQAATSCGENRLARLRFGAIIAARARELVATAGRSMVLRYPWGGRLWRKLFVQSPRQRRGFSDTTVTALQPDTFSDPSATRMASMLHKPHRTSAIALGPSPPRSLGPRQAKKNTSGEKNPWHALKFWSLPRPASSDRRASDAAIPPRSRFPSSRSTRSASIEFWCGEASTLRDGENDRVRPEDVFWPRPGERTKRIKTRPPAWWSLPYHHPFKRGAAQWCSSDHMTGGRAQFLGPAPGGACIGCAYARHRSDDATRPPGRGDRHHPPAVQRRARPPPKSGLVHHERRGAAAFCRCRKRLPFVVASQISPSGMTLAGKYGHRPIISLGSMSTQGLMALPTQWGFAEDAREEGPATTVSRAQLGAWLAELAHRGDPRGRLGARAGEGTDATGTTNTMSARCKRAGSAAVSPRPKTRFEKNRRRRGCGLHHRPRRTIWFKTIKRPDAGERRRSATIVRLRARLGQSGKTQDAAGIWWHAT